MKNVCIVNAHWSNRGDEAALRPIINRIIERYPDVTLSVVFKDRKDIQFFPYPNVKFCVAQYLPEDLNEILVAVKRKKHDDVAMQRLIDCLEDADLIIYSPGGAVVSDYFWWKKQLEYLFPFIWAKKYNIPIVVAAPSMGPFDDDAEKNCYRREWIGISKKICIRENISAGYLKQIGIGNVETTIDTAFYDDPVKEECEVLFNSNGNLCNFFKEYDKVVAATLSDFTWHVQYLNRKEELIKQEELLRLFFKKLYEEGIGLLFVPQLFGNQDDSAYLMKFFTDNCFLLPQKYDTYFQQYIISKCYALIGMRYHSNIFASKMGIPFVAIGYEEKMYGFMSDWGLDEYLIKLPELSYEVLCEKWNHLNLQYNQLQLDLKEKRELWRTKAAKTIDSILFAIDEIKECK